MANSSGVKLRNIFITGQPASGKTTLFRRIAEKYQKSSFDICSYGFFTEEIRNNGSRIGFDVVTIDGKIRAPLSRTNEYTNRERVDFPRVGQYNVFVEDFEATIDTIFSDIQTPCLCFIDEIGKMELLSRKFRQIVENLIDRTNLIFVATIPIRAIPFVDAIRSRRDHRLITVTRENRHGNRLYDELVRLIDDSVQQATGKSG